MWTWQIPTLTLRFGGGGFCEPFCWKECDEDLDIFKLLECRSELDTFLVLYLHLEEWTILSLLNLIVLLFRCVVGCESGCPISPRLTVFLLLWNP